MLNKNSNFQFQSIGLFSQNKPTFNMPSTTTTFGFGQSSTTNSNSLFGSKPLGTGFSTSFGGPNTSSFQSSNSGFGSAPSSNASLFNNSFKPVGQSSGFTFGNASNVGSTTLGEKFCI